MPVVTGWNNVHIITSSVIVRMLSVLLLVSWNGVDAATKEPLKYDTIRQNAVARTNTDIVLECPISNISEIARFSWGRMTGNNEEVISRLMTVDFKFENGKYGFSSMFNLHINNINLADARTYRCSIQESNALNLVVKEVNLAVVDKILCNDNASMNQPHRSGDSISLQCDVRTKGAFTPKKKWVTASGRNIADNIQSNFYQYRLSDSDNGQIFRCVIWSQHFETSCATGPIKVVYKPKVTNVSIISREINQRQYLLGEGVELLCQADGNPEPTYHWYKKPIGASNYTLISRVPSPKYDIHELKPYHSAIYRCTATNLVLDRVMNDSKEISLMVSAAEKITPGSDEDGDGLNTSSGVKIVIDEKIALLAACILGAIVLIGILIIILLSRRNHRNTDTYAPPPADPNQFYETCDQDNAWPTPAPMVANRNRLQRSTTSELLCQSQRNLDTEPLHQPHQLPESAPLNSFRTPKPNRYVLPTKYISSDSLVDNVDKVHHPVRV